MPPRRRNPLSDTASYIFVDREDPKRTFRKAVAEIPKDGILIRSWYGVGGQGKTALARELFRMSAPKAAPEYAHLRRAMLDLHERPVTDPDRLLIWIRNAFAKAGVAFPAFDIAFAAMWEKTRGDEPLPTFVNPWLYRSSEAVTEFGAEALTKLPEAATDWLSSIPLLGYLVKKGTKWAVDQSKIKWIERSRPYLEALRNGGKPLEDYQISNLLPWMLAQDLNDHLDRHPKERFVLFVDEYERVMDGAGMGARWGVNRFDAHMRSVLTETNGLLALFFSRERLPWGDDPAWREDLENNQHILGGLSDKDAQEWLLRVPIADASIRQAMIAGARETNQGEDPVYPLMLDLQVEHWRNLGASARPQDFSVKEEGAEARRLVLVNRLLRDYDKATQELLVRLSVCQSFDRIAFEHIASTFNISVQVSDFDLLSDLSIMEVREDGWISPHRAIADAIGRAGDKTLSGSSPDVLLAHFLIRSQPRPGDTLQEDTLACFVEAVGLRRLKGIAGYVEWLQEVSAPLLWANQHRFIQKIWRDTLAWVEDQPGDRRSQVALCCGQIALRLIDEGRHDEAMSLAQKQLDMCREIFGENHKDTGEAYFALGKVCSYKGLYKHAVEQYTKSVQIGEKTLDASDPILGARYLNLANALQSMNLLPQAADASLKAYTILEKVYGDASLDTSQVRLTVARILLGNGEGAKAVEFCQSALKVMVSILGPNHVELGYVYDTLGNALANQKRYGEAEEAFQKGLALRQLHFGEDSVEVSAVHRNLAGLYHSQSRLTEAEASCRLSLKSAIKHLGEQHPAVGELYNNLAHFISHQDRDAEVEDLYRKALTCVAPSRGENHPLFGEIYASMARAVLNQGRHDEAMELYDEGVGRLQKIDPTPVMLIVTHCAEFGILLEKHELHTTAEECYRTGLVYASQGLGEHHAQTYTHTILLARSLEFQGRHPEAETFRRQAIDIAVTLYGEEHNQVAKDLAELGNNLAAQDRAQEGFDYVQKSLEMRANLRMDSLKQALN